MKSLVLLSVPVLCLAARGDDPPPPDKEAPNALREQYQLAAKRYEFFLDTDRKVPLMFEPKPIFHWSSDNDWSGDVFVWTSNGRPLVVGCVLSSPTKPQRTEIHEFHALSAEPLSPVEMAAKYRWAPKAGVEVQKLDGVPAATYPANPNGSAHAIAGVTSDDGRVTILMPHPERTLRAANFSWAPRDWQGDSPWQRIFRNARVWVG